MTSGKVKTSKIGQSAVIFLKNEKRSAGRRTYSINKNFRRVIQRLQRIWALGIGLVPEIGLRYSPAFIRKIKIN